MGKNKNLLSEGIILAALPVLSYAVAFHFERGYLAFFGIPDFLARVSYESFFWAFSAVIASTLFFPPAIYAFFLWCPQNKKYTIAYLLLCVATALFLFSWGVLGNLIKAIYFSTIIIIVITIYYLFPIFAKYMDTDDTNLYSKIDSIFGKGFYSTFISLAIFLPLLAGIIGIKEAKTQKEFLVTKINENNYALVRAYQDFSIYVEVKAIWKDLYNSEIALKHKYILRYENRDTPPLTPKIIYREIKK